MTPAQHYREAERILARGRIKWVEEAESFTGKKLSWDQARDVEQTMVAVAQVHATLATVEAHNSLGWSSPEEVKKP